MNDQIPEDVILKVENLKKHFPVRKGFFRRVVGHVEAVKGVTFEIPKGKTLGLVGESGSGKTTTGRMILRAIAPTEGRILFRSKNEVVDIAQLGRKQMRDIHADAQMIFQDPNSSLNPRMSVFEIISEPLRARRWKKNDSINRVRDLLRMVGLDPRLMRRFPQAFSGGQRQRIGLARALALNPSLIVADEPVSALDVSVQAQILNLLERVQKELNLTLLFIAHDIGVVRYICDQVAVMYAGSLVEVADADKIFENPRHPYTRALIAAAPPPDPHAEWSAHRDDSAKSADRIPDTGCPYAPRCPHAHEACKVMPALRVPEGTNKRHHVACHLYPAPGRALEGACQVGLGENLNP